MYQIGDQISHPLHGAGTISEIVDERLNGVRRSYYVLRPVGKSITVKIPVDKCEEVGVRDVMSAEEADTIIQMFSEFDTSESGSWNKRFRDNMALIKSGDPKMVAFVIKKLVRRDVSCGISTAEKKMLVTAKNILISELSLAKDRSFSEIEMIINTLCLE